MCDIQPQALKLKTHHSYVIRGKSNRESLNSESSWKSDLNISVPSELSDITNTTGQNILPLCSKSSREYYKKYEHDELPVKDNSNVNNSTSSNSDKRRDDKVSLTNSDLAKLEKKIFDTVSQELQTDDSSISSLESNIKFFKTTVQEIFDKFFTTMQDFESYKKRFNEILAKNRKQSLTEMEDFVKDMINHIMSSDSSFTNESHKWTGSTFVKETNVTSNSRDFSTETNTSGSAKSLHNMQPIVEAYKNENYLTDSTVEENTSKLKRHIKNGEIFNIYLLSGMPYVEIKMNNRNLLSEINIKEPASYEYLKEQIASAENIKKLNIKKTELERYVQQQEDKNMPDVEIPVKVSYAKKNIHLDEDFDNDHDKKDNNKSFISKICNYLCKKIRKSSVG